MSTPTVFLTRRPMLRDSILDECPSASSFLLDRLEKLVKEFSLDWVPGKYGNGAYFLCSQLAKSQHSNPKDFTRGWIRFKTNTNWEHYPVSPAVKKLTGDYLKNFKTLYEHYTSINLGSINALHVVNWVGALAYLLKGKQIDFPKPAPVLTLVEEPKRVIPSPSPKVIPFPSSTSVEPEKAYQDQLALLSLHTSYIFKQEVVIRDTLRPGQNTRRYDLVEFQDDSIIIYELKKNMITSLDVSTTLGEKGYLTLASEKYKGRNITLVFTSPNGIEPAAQRIIDLMPGVEFYSVQSIATRLLQDAIERVKEESPAQTQWYLEKKLLPQFSLIIPSELYLPRTA